MSDLAEVDIVPSVLQVGLYDGGVGLPVEQGVSQGQQLHDGGVERVAAVTEQRHSQLQPLTIVTLVVGELHQRDQLL